MAERADLKGNTYASKEVTKDSTLYIRVTKEQKAAYCEAANGEKLSQWITRALDDKAANKA